MCFPLLCTKRRWSSDSGGHFHLTASLTGGRTATVPMFLSGTWWLPTGTGVSHRGCRAAGMSSAPWQAQTGVCRVLCRTALISWHQKVSSLCSEQKDAKYFFSRMVALSVALAFSHWTVTNGCLRSWGHASSLFLSWCQGSDYPSFSCSSIPLQHMVFSFSSQQNESWEGRKEFCRPAVQRTELLNAFSDSFSSPWQKCQQGGGSELHARKGRLPF